MKTFSVNMVNFKGQIKYLSKIPNTNKIYISDYKDSQKISQDCTEYLANIGRESDTIEKTLGIFHSKATNGVYYTDPLEKVSDELRSKVDYIIYDNKPKYPDLEKEIKESFLGSENNSYEKQFEAVRDYYQRLEAAADKEMKKTDANLPFDFYNDRIKFARLKQQEAQEALNLCMSGSDLITKKKNIQFEIKYKQALLYNEKRNLEETKALLKELPFQKRIRKEELDLMKSKVEFLKKAVAINQRLAQRYPRHIEESKKENEELTVKIKKLEQDIISKQTTVWGFASAILKCKKDIIKSPKLFAELEKEINLKKATLENIKKELMPKFNELKKFYIIHKLI